MTNTTSLPAAAGDRPPSSARERRWPGAKVFVKDLRLASNIARDEGVGAVIDDDLDGGVPGQARPGRSR